MRNELGSDPLLVPEQDSAHLADEPLSIFSERPAEGLVGPLVWCDHMDLLATMHVTPQEGRSVKVWRLLSDEKTPSCLFSYKGHSADWHPSAVAWSPRSLSHPEQLLGVGDENGDIASVYVEQKNTRADTTMAVLRRAHSAKVVAMEWVLTPFVVDESLNGDHCSLINWPHIRNLDDVRDANRRALEKADTVLSGISEKRSSSEVGYLVTLSEEGHLSVHAEGLAPVLSWTIPSPSLLEGGGCVYGPLLRVSSDLNTIAVLRTYAETNAQEIVFVDTSQVLGSRGLADYAKLVLGLQQLQRYIVDGINILLHGPLKSAAAAMKKLVGPLKAEMEEEGKEAEDDVVARSVTEELIRCFHGLGVPSPALSRALETIGYQTQALQKLQRELTEALDMFSVICAHQLEPAVDTLMASAHSIRLMAHNDHYAAILGDGHGGLHWAIDQLLTAGEHLTALLDEASSQVSYAIGCVALPLITQLVRWQRMGERLGEIDDVELDEKERVLQFVQAVHVSSTWRCGKNLDHLKDTIRLFGEAAATSSDSQMTLRKCAADIGAILIDLMSSQRILCGESLRVFDQTLEISRRSYACARVDENNKTITSQSVDTFDSPVDARWDEQHTLPTRSKASEILRVCWSDSVEDPLEPDSHLFYVEVKRSRRKSRGLTSVLKFRGVRVPAPTPTAYTLAPHARVSWLLPKIYRDGQVLSLLLHTHTTKPVMDMFKRSCVDDDSDHQMSVCLVSLEGSPRLPRYTSQNCEVLSKVPPVISRILPSSDYLWSTHTTTAPLRGLASVFENRCSKLLTLDLEGGAHDDSGETVNPIMKLFH